MPKASALHFNLNHKGKEKSLINLVSAVIFFTFRHSAVVAGLSEHGRGPVAHQHQPVC